MERRYDIDWVRVIAIGLLLIYHIAIGFQPWGGMIWFITNSEPLTDLWIPMSMLNVWRIPLLFFVSGMGVSFAMRRRKLSELFGERAKRIMVPLVFGFLVISPVHVYLFQSYVSLSTSYLPNMGHLWFLGNIFIYVLILAPLFYLLKRHEDRPLGRSLKMLMGHPLSFLIILAGFVAEALLVNPTMFSMYAQTWHGFFLGLIAFFFGYTSVFAGQSFWDHTINWRYAFLILGIGLFAYRYVELKLNAPNFLLAIESVFWILSVFGFASKYLNKPSKTLTYLSEGAYPIYIIHMIWLYLASYWIFPLTLAPVLKLLLVISITFGGCLLMYEFLIRRYALLRPIFGLKRRTK